ncbi:M48 family metalloprotease [Candidatus Bathyarchaeota archaeon]|nr:M48 family metalloprotease [Candidatus Bathyarchaeota archaeon]
MAGAIICAAISTLPDKETLRITCIVIGWLLTLAAVGPSLSGYVWERVRKGKAENLDPNIIIPGWKQFCQSMGIEKDIKVKVFPNLRNAYANGTTIEIGQPVLDSLDSVSIKAVFTHELAHIKINDALKLKHLLVVILVCSIFVSVAHAIVPLVFTHSVVQLGFSHFTFSVLSILMIGFMGIAIRFMSWPDEYKADLVAMQHVNRGAVVSFLTAMAALRKMDVTRDFYLHPSINKRKANLGWSRKTRFRKWYFEL